MRNLVLLLVLLAGFASGYLVADYRNKGTREALQHAIATGKLLESELETSADQLKKQLADVNETHRRELEALRKSYRANAAEWRRIREGLDVDIKRSYAKLAESEASLKTLIAQRDAATGGNRDSLDREIARLRADVSELRREIESSACLQARVPPGVSRSLNETGEPAKK